MIYIAFGIIGMVAVLSRLIPHEWGFTLAAALFVVPTICSSTKQYMILLALAIGFLLFSDWVLGFYGFLNMLITYQGWIAFLVIMRLLSEKKYVVYLAPFLGTTAFFLISNYGVWLLSDMYDKTFSGLLLCYEMGLPFYKVQALADSLAGIASIALIRGVISGNILIDRTGSLALRFGTRGHTSPS